MEQITGTNPEGEIKMLKVENKDSIELSRSVKKQYSWSIKLYSENAEGLTERLVKINEQLREKFKDELLEEK